MGGRLVGKPAELRSNIGRRSRPLTPVFEKLVFVLWTCPSITGGRWRHEELLLPGCHNC